jgi:hypothetical protein
MAVKASAAVTLSAVVDVQAIWRYYLLQSSTLAAPAKPTAYPPPSAWTDTEPIFDPTKTETLYVVDCNVFSDGTFDYTAVSVSTAFEAAKLAYNKANNAETNANEALNQSALNEENVAELSSQTTSEIIKTEEAILQTVAEQYHVKGETERLVSEVSLALEHTKEEFTLQFTDFNADLEAITAGTDAEFEEIRKYIRFVDGMILLGEVGNELELQISNDRISFLQDGAEVAYFSNRRLYVTDAQILHSLQLGSFAWMPRANGNLSFKKV